MQQITINQVVKFTTAKDLEPGEWFQLKNEKDATIYIMLNEDLFHGKDDIAAVNTETGDIENISKKKVVRVVSENALIIFPVEKGAI